MRTTIVALLLVVGVGVVLIALTWMMPVQMTMKISISVSQFFIQCAQGFHAFLKVLEFFGLNSRP